MSDAAPAPRRVYFAFWPDDATRAAISAARARLFPLAGNPVALEDLHVTAAFVGSVEVSRLPALQGLATAVPPFGLRFDRVDFWPRPRVLVAVASQWPAPATRAVEALWSELSRLGYRRDPRPWRPHLTLAREAGAPRRNVAWPTVDWPVRRLALVESLPAADVPPGGQRYRPLA